MIISTEQAKAWPTTRTAERHEMIRSWESDSNRDLRRVDELLRDISQGVWAASWLQDMDVIAWRLLHNPAEVADLATEDHPYCTGAELAAWVAELRQLTIDQGWYPIYDLDEAIMLVGRVATLADATAYASEVARPPEEVASGE